MSSKTLMTVLGLAAVAGCGGSGASRSQGSETAAADSAAAAKPAPPPDQLRVTVVMIGKKLGANNFMIEPTFQFAPSDTVFLSVGTEGTPASATLSTKWVSQKGEILDSSSQTIQPKGAENTAFRVARPKGWPVGVYKVTIFANGDSVDTKTFAVKK